MNKTPLTRDSAKLILSSYRAGDQDPFFEETLALLESDDELQAWFEREQARCSALSAKIAELEPPPGLRETILAGAKVSRRPQRGWWNRRSALAAAAVLLLSMLGTWMWLKRPYTSGDYTVDAYGRDMTTYLSRFFLLDYENEKVAEVKGWLAKNHQVEGFEVPPALVRHPSLGCEVISWHDLKAYLICFDVNGEVVHLFYLPHGSKLQGVPEEDAPRFAQIGKDWASVSWAKGDDLYFLTTLGPEELVQGVLLL